MMNKFLIILSVLFTLVFSSGCGTIYKSKADIDARKTQKAIDLTATAGLQTQAAEEAQRTLFAAGPTSTPKISFLMPITPSPTSTGTPIPTPFPIGNLVLKEGEPWVDVYDTAGDKARQIGELVQGSSWPVVQHHSLGHYYKLMIVGLIEPLDFDVETSETRCISHSWGHVEDKSFCHAHLLNENKELVGQLDGNIKVERLDTLINEKGVATYYKVRFLVWVPESKSNYSD